MKAEFHDELTELAARAAARVFPPEPSNVVSLTAQRERRQPPSRGWLREPRLPAAGSLAVIHNADARLLDRNVQSSKMVHAALLLLMLEAAYADLVSPSA
jgi:hypothetical protein